MTNEVQDTAIYSNCMTEVSQRLVLVEKIVVGSVTTGEKAFNSELVFIQLRKILELIAFASLTSNREIYSSAYNDFSKHWNAKRILQALAKINVDFFPTALEPPVRQADNTVHFPKLDDGFLTKIDFVTLYNASSEIIHTKNPFSVKKPVTQIDYSVDEWVARIRKLLTWHVMHLVNGGKWVVNLSKDGSVQLFPASPVPEQSLKAMV